MFRILRICHADPNWKETRFASTTKGENEAMKLRRKDGYCFDASCDKGTFFFFPKTLILGLTQNMTLRKNENAILRWTVPWPR